MWERNAIRVGYDPRRSRNNPELDGIVRAFERNFREFKQTGRGTKTRRGYVAVMRALLEQYLDEPDSLTDLRPGAAEVSERARLKPEALRWERGFSAEDPFSRADLGEERFFFYTAGGSYSALYGEPAQDPYYVTGLWNHGPFVYTLEKLYATEQKTTHRVAGEEVYGRLVKRGKGGSFWLLADPAGLEGGSRVVNLKSYQSLGPACKQADRLAARLEIRFLVAGVVYSHCTR